MLLVENRNNLFVLPGMEENAQYEKLMEYIDELNSKETKYIVTPIDLRPEFKDDYSKDIEMITSPNLMIFMIMFNKTNIIILNIGDKYRTDIGGILLDILSSSATEFVQMCDGHFKVEKHRSYTNLSRKYVTLSEIFEKE